ncbi:MAG: hypothetical protein QM754_04385 [Tepidisphaeraceae bacterium]
MKSVQAPLFGIRTAKHAFAWALVGLLAAGAIAAKPTTKPATQPAGPMTFELKGDASQWDAKAREKIVSAMTEAVAVYNLHAKFKQHIPVVYSPQTPTADASFNGQIRFGGQIGTRTALHEIGHILGVGTARNWRNFIKDGKWTGKYAVAQLKAFDGPDAVLHADRQHFWPYGLNFDSEGTSAEQYRRHVAMVAAFRADLGLSPAPKIATSQPAHTK